MTYISNLTDEELTEQIQLYNAYRSQLTQDVTSVVMIDGATPHVRLYVRRDAGRRALHRVANNISDLAEVDVTDPTATPPKRQHEHYTSQTKETRYVVTSNEQGVQYVLQSNGSLRDVTKVKMADIAIYNTKAAAEYAADRHNVRNAKVWGL